jgi:hypothetical protein
MAIDAERTEGMKVLEIDVEAATFHSPDGQKVLDLLKQLADIPMSTEVKQPQANEIADGPDPDAAAGLA